MAEYVIQLGGDNPDYTPYGGAREFIRHKGPEAIVHGPAECLAGEVGVFVPSLGYEVPIADLYHRGEACDVMTVHGPAKADVPFIKGYADLYRVTSGSGKSFVATGKHRVMTARGWAFVCDLVAGERLLEFAVYPLVSSLEHGPLEFLQDGHYSLNTGVDCLGNCFAYRRLCDEQFQLAANGDQGVAPLSSGACGCNHVCRQMDGPCRDARAHNHLCQSSRRLSSGGYSDLSGCALHNQYRIVQETLLPGGDWSQLVSQFQRVTVPLWQAEQPNRNSDSKHWPCNSLSLFRDVSGRHGHAEYSSQVDLPLCACSLSYRKSEELNPLVPLSSVCNPSSFHLSNPYYTAQWNTVSSVEFVREDVYYDMHVPGYGHYIAGGFLHHNTGKTLAALNKLHMCACKYPGAAIVICRKTLASTYSTVLQTFMNKVLDIDSPTDHYGGEKPEWFDYANGSRIWVAGLDKPGRILSAELDLVYVNQSEELTIEDWETLTTRTTGRAGHMPYSQTIGDANPSYPNHWMYNRPSLRLFYSHHTENPALYDPQTGQITEQGKRTMGVLGALTGLRRVRLLDGKPAQAEGVIYEGWNDSLHLIYRDALPACDRYIAGVDWGFTHPGVIGVWGLDGDGRMYLVAQVYRTKQLLDWWVERAKELQAEFRVEAWYCGPDQPANIQAFAQAGLNAFPAVNDVRPGIDAVAQRLQVAGDGKPRLFVVRDSLRYKDMELEDARKPFATEQEFHSYVWASGNKEQPVKEYDDGLDQTRYSVMGANVGSRRAKVLTVDMEMSYA